MFKKPFRPVLSESILFAPILNPLYTNGFFFLVWYNKLGIVHCTYLRLSGYNFFFKYCCFFVWRFFYITVWTLMCGVSSRSSLFVKVPVYGVSCIRRVKKSEPMIVCTGLNLFLYILQLVFYIFTLIYFYSQLKYRWSGLWLLIVCQNSLISMRGSRKFCQSGSKFDDNGFFCCFFLSWWGDRGSKYHFKWTNIGPPEKRHWNGVSLACRWCPYIECWLVCFVIVKGIGTSITKKPYIFVILQGGSGPPVASSGSAHDQTAPKGTV